MRNQQIIRLFVCYFLSLEIFCCFFRGALTTVLPYVLRAKNYVKLRETGKNQETVDDGYKQSAINFLDINLLERTRRKRRNPILNRPSLITPNTLLDRD